MNLSLTELRAVFREMERRLPACNVREIRQPSDTCIWMSLRSPGENLALTLETRHGEARFLVAGDRPGTRTPPPSFLSKLRKDLTGARVSRVDMPRADRVIVFHFARGADETALIAEATGHHPNLFLATSDLTLVLAMNPTRSHQRQLISGLRYEPPPTPPPDTEISRGSRLEGRSSPSLELAARYEAETRVHELERYRRILLKAINNETKRGRRKLENMREDLASAREFERFRLYGELLKLSLHEVSPGQTELQVPNSFDPSDSPVTIPLRVDLDPVANLNWLFRRYKKGTRSVPVIRARSSQEQQRLELLSALAADVAGAESDGQLRESVAKAIGRFPWLPGLEPTASRKAAQDRPRQPYREFLSSTGRRILVGRCSADNRTLTFQVAAPNDVWLHARGFSGSHVIIPLARNQEPDPTTLVEAAHLATQYSRGPKQGFSEVLWTRRKYVRARKGAPAGEVSVSRDRNLAFEFDPSILSRVEAVVKHP